MAGWVSRSWLEQIVTRRQAPGPGVRARVSHVAAPETTVRAGRRRVRISSADKLLFPADGITKAGPRRYYAAVAPGDGAARARPPLNLWRWNKGIDSDVVVEQEIPRARRTGSGE